MSATKDKKRSEELEKAMADVGRQVREFVQGDEWLDYLQAASRFRSYSPRNMLWMFAQWQDRRVANEAMRWMAGAVGGLGPAWDAMPEISRPGAFSTWKDVGRKVRKGEKALAVLAPVIVTKVDETTGEEKKVVVGFKEKRRTFDVSQTEGEPLPEHPGDRMLEGAGDERVWAAVVDAVGELGVSVEVDVIDRPGVRGFFAPSEKRIVVDSRLPGAMQVRVLLHETAHALLHDPDQYAAAHSTPRNVKELEAESTAMVAGRLLGIDTANVSLGYLASWLDGDDVDKLGELATRVVEAARRIVDAVESATEKAA